MAKKKQTTFEENLRSIETIIRELDSGTLGIDAMLERYEQGMALIAESLQTIDKAELTIRTITEKFQSEQGD
jgi:exodeoxyribonuclease VII small subunit